MSLSSDKPHVINTVEGGWMKKETFSLLLWIKSIKDAIYSSGLPASLLCSLQVLH